MCLELAARLEMAISATIEALDALLLASQLLYL
jgi:hypothetical protein